MSEPEVYPIHLVMHYNRYKGTLFDVEGNILMGESGLKLNVFREEMKDMMSDQKVRCIHYMTKEPSYIYFIVNQDQADKFQHYRDHGSPFPGTYYHVYPDN